MDTAIVLFTRDLRLHDNPALHQACARARQVVPLFVADPAIPAPPNRARFLAESLADLRQQQASSLAYFDVFWLFAVLCLGLVLLVLLMKRSVAEKGELIGGE